MKILTKSKINLTELPPFPFRDSRLDSSMPAGAQGRNSGLVATMGDSGEWGTLDEADEQNGMRASRRAVRASKLARFRIVPTSL